MTSRFLATLTVPGRLEAVRPAAALLVELARRLEVPAAANTLFENAIVEAFNNALEHTPGAFGSGIHCEFELGPDRLSIRVMSDAARAPVELTVPPGMAPPAADSWGAIAESGYGLYLIRAVFPDVRPISRGARYGVEMTLSLAPVEVAPPGDSS